VQVTNDFVDAAQNAGVQHIVKLSAIGVGSETFAVGERHAANERHIRNSDLAFTFLRPNSFMQNFINYFPPRDGVIHLPWGKGKASFVDGRDIATVAVRALTNEGHKNKVYTLTGPAALSIDEVAPLFLMRPIAKSNTLICRNQPPATPCLMQVWRNGRWTC